MSPNRNKLIIIFCLAIVLLSSIAINTFHFCENKELKTNNQILEESLNRYTQEYGCLKFNLNLALNKCDSTNFNTLTVKDASLLEHSFSDYRGYNVLFCRISAKYCETCNRYALKLAQQINDLDVIFVIDKATRRGFMNMHDTYNLDYEEMIACDDLGMKIETELFPYFFMINNKGMLSNIYMPYKNCERLDLEMINKIISKVNIMNRDLTLNYEIQ